MAQEFFAGEVAFADALLCQLVDNFGFRRDRGVIRPGNPASVLAFHAGTANQNVLDRIIQNVPHVKHTGNVGGRDDNCVRPAPIGLGTEKFMVGPVSIPLTFHCLRGVFRG